MKTVDLRRKGKRTSRRIDSSPLMRQCVVETLEIRRLLSITPVLENHNDASSNGQDTTETLLNTSNVNSTDFGRIFDTTLDGQVYAQPLTVPNVDITTGANQGIHNVVYVATMNDSLYAIDATTGTILWQDSFLQISDPQVTTVGSPAPTAGVFTIPGDGTYNAFVNGSDVGPQLGIISTPVINSAATTLYLVACTQEIRSGSTPESVPASGSPLTASLSTAISDGYDIHYVERLWAINLSNGAVAITPSNPSVEPTTGGQVIADTIYDSTAFSDYGQNPSNPSNAGYKYVVGPYVKGTGNNNPSGASTSVPGDGWVVNSNDTTSPWGRLGETPQEDQYVAFNGLLQMGRTALSIIDGQVMFGFASHGDDGPYYGWLLGYSDTTLANTVAFLTVPTYEPFSTVSGDHSQYDAQAGFWGAGGTITTDGTYIYVAVGNGAFNPNTSNFSSSYYTMDGSHKVELPLDNDYGDAVLKLQIDLNANQNGTANGTYDPDVYDPNGYGIKVVDYFEPSNEYEMNANDEDTGSGGVTLIPATNPNGQNWLSDGDELLTVTGKEGRIYLLDAGNLGGFNTTYTSDGYTTSNSQNPADFDNVVGEFYYYYDKNSGTPENNQTYKGYDVESYYDGDLYIGLGGGTSGDTYLPEFEIPVSSMITGTVPPDSATSATISSETGNNFGGRGTTSTISTNGSNTPIVWSMYVTLGSGDYLAAYNGTNLATELYSSETNISRDSLTNDGKVPGTSLMNATGVKFAIPTVFNGMVYAGTGGGSGSGGYAEGTLVGYGLLPSYVQSGSNFAAPTSLSGTTNGTSDINLTWTINSSDEDEFAIERSTNGGAFSIIGYVQHGVNTFSDTSVSANNTYEYEVEAVSGGSMTTPATGGATPEITSAFTNTATVFDGTPAPLITQAAAASPNPVTSGKTTALSVAATDVDGASSLTYTWSVLGTPPAPVNFSANGTNAASNTTATFGAAGTYTIQVTVTDPNNNSSTSDVTVVMDAVLTAVNVIPSGSSLSEDQSEQFTVSSYDQFGNAEGESFHWSTTGGTIGNDGILVAPGTPGTYTVTATSISGGLSGMGTVIVGNTAPVITTAAAASPGTLTAGGSTNLSVFATDVNGNSTLTYTWSTVMSPNGASAPVFGGTNGSNAGQNTQVTIATAGNYVFHVTIEDQAGMVVSANVLVTVTQQVEAGPEGGGVSGADTVEMNVSTLVSAPPGNMFSLVEGSPNTASTLLASAESGGTDIDSPTSPLFNEDSVLAD